VKPKEEIKNIAETPKSVPQKAPDATNKRL
jgi:hypothetical protein